MFEKELFALVGRSKHKINKNKNKKANFSKVSVDVTESKNVADGIDLYGEAAKYFKK
jgi:hypothetical protein